MARQGRPSVHQHLQQHHAIPQYVSPPAPAIQQVPHHHQQSLDTMPLPDGWQKAMTPEGESYYVNHKTRTTSWFHPGIPHHQHSHSFAGMSGGIGHPQYAQFGRQHQQQGMNLQQLQAEKEMMRRRQQYELQRQEQMLQMAGNEAAASRIPTTLYGDPYLSSSGHTHQASHDSGLGVPTMPYPSDIGMMDLDEGMDTSTGLQQHSKPGGMPMGTRGPPNRTLEYLDSMPGTDVDAGIPEQQPSMDTDHTLPGGMGTDLLGELAWV